MVPLFIILAAGFVQGPPWAHFSRGRYLAQTQELVEIGSGAHSGGTGFHYTMKLTSKKLDAKPTVFWADSATCPAMTPIIASMTKIKLPRPAPYGVPGQLQEVVVDGSGYELSAPSSDIMGALTISSNEGSPLSQWVDDALARLKGCWSPSPPHQSR